MLIEQTPAFTLRAETGLSARVEPQVGCYVGYAETARDAWSFATNLEIRDERDLPLRRLLTLEALRAKGAFAQETITLNLEEL